MKKHFCLLFLFYFLFMSGRAQLYTMRHLGVEHGLSNNYVKDIIQDKRGFIWIATEVGLSRFDGTKFTNYKADDSLLNGDALNVLLYDESRDYIWIGGKFGGLNFIDCSTGKICQCVLPEKVSFGNVDNLFRASDGGLWIVPHHSDILYYDIARKEFKTLADIGINVEYKSNWCVFDDGNGLLYIGHVQNGLSVVNLKNKTVQSFHNKPDDPQSLPGNSVYTIYRDRMDNIWVGTDQGLGLFNPKTEKFIVFRHEQKNPHSLVADHIYDIKEMNDGTLWIAADIGGISILDLHSITFANVSAVLFQNFTANDNVKNTISSNNIRSLLQDSFGNIWIGNYSCGIDFISHTPDLFYRLQYFSDNGGHLKYKPVWGMYKDSQGRLWVGGENEVSLFKDDTFVKSVDISRSLSRPYGQVFSIVEDGKDHLLLGIYDDGLLRYNTQTNHIERIPMDLKNSDVITFYSDIDNTIWVGTEYGVYHYRNGKLYKRNDINRLLNDKSVYGILRDKQGKLWIGTYGGGIVILDKDYKLTISLNSRKSLSSDAINMLYMDSNGGVWAATRNGVNYIKDTNHPSKVMIYNREQGIEDDFIRSVQEDDNGNIWLSTNNLIVFYDREKERFENYDYRSGVLKGNFIEGSACRGDNGMLYFGSLDGVCCFHPKSFSIEKKVSPVKIVECRSLENKIEDKKDVPIVPISNGFIHLSYNQNSFRIHFSVPDYSQSDLVEYAYMVEGLEEKWISTLNESQVTFRNIPHGNYIFKVKARLRNHEWDTNQMAFLQICIEPPLWLTWYAKVAYIFLVFIVIYIGIRLYMRRLILKNSLELSESKSRNEQELNNERLRFYTNITHELRTPLTLILGPLEDLLNEQNISYLYRKKIKVIYDNALKLLRLVNRILEFRKMETQNRKLVVCKGDLGRLVTEIGLQYKELNRNKKVSFSIDVDPEILGVYFDAEVVSTILDNLLSNAMKYTPEGEIKLSLHSIEELGNRYIEIKVSDTGYGIDEESLPHVFERYYQSKGKHQVSGTGIGLALVKALVDLHEGSIWVESKGNKGTIFTFRILQDNIYPDSLHKEEIEINIKQKENDKNINDFPILLVVEDNNDIRDYITISMENNYHVLTATNGKEGMELANKYIPDIIISDVMMPEMDGIEFCKQIKRDIRTCHIPVILLTAKDSIQDKEDGYRSGADSYLTKPFSIRLLNSRILNLLETRKKLAEIIIESNQRITPFSKGQQDGVILGKLDKDFLDRFSNIVQENITMEKLDLNFMTEKMNMSHSTLYRKIKGLTGMSGNEFIRKLKLNYGAFLLKENKLNISETAYACGFNDINYFRKCFKEEYGITPSQYLKQL